MQTYTKEIWGERFAKVGLRLTPRRLAVIETVAENPHTSADDIHQLASEKVTSLTRQSVYLNLAEFVECGLVRKISPEDSAAKYETRVGDNHHHFVCEGCGMIADIDCALGEAPCLIPDAHGDTGFYVQTAEVTYRGFCKECFTAEKKDQLEKISA